MPLLLWTQHLTDSNGPRQKRQVGRTGHARGFLKVRRAGTLHLEVTRGPEAPDGGGAGAWERSDWPEGPARPRGSGFRGRDTSWQRAYRLSRAQVLLPGRQAEAGSGASVLGLKAAEHWPGRGRCPRASSATSRDTRKAELRAVGACTCHASSLVRVG